MDVNNLKNSVLEIDLKLQIATSGQTKFIHFKDLKEDFDPILFDQITSAVEQSLIRQQKQTEDFMNDYFKEGK